MLKMEPEPRRLQAMSRADAAAADSVTCNLCAQLGHKQVECPFNAAAKEAAAAAARADARPGSRRKRVAVAAKANESATPATDIEAP